MMQRAEILRQLQQHQAEIRQAFGVERLALFGSAARDELRENSDVDMLVAFRETVTFNAYLGLKRYLEELLRRPKPCVAFLVVHQVLDVVHGSVGKATSCHIRRVLKIQYEPRIKTSG
jgi:predicted nucleotidyltransferase